MPMRSVHRLTLSVAAAFALAVAAAGAASAATTAEVVDGDPTVLKVTGDAGVNEIGVGDGEVSDAAGPVTAGGGCVAEDEHTVRCDGFDVNEVAGGGGDDTIHVGAIEHDSHVDGGAGDDHLESFGSNIVVTVLVGGPGADTFDGFGRTTDVVDYRDRSAGVTVSRDGVANDGEPGEGDDVAPGIESVIGGGGPDTIDLRDGTTSVSPGAAFGGPGADHLIAGAEGARLAGGGGDDVLEGGSGPDVLDDDGCAPVAADTGERGYCSGTGDDTLRGAGGADALHGEFGDDSLDGGPGDDELDGGPGADDVRGGEDVDRATTALPDIDPASDVPIPPVPITVTLDDRADDGSSYDDHHDNVHTDVEEVVGGRLGDTLVGSPGIETLRGGDGPDVLDGLGGPDRVFGGGGDDTIRARDRETDLVSCGDGNDAAVTDDIDDTGPTCEQVDSAGPPPVVTSVPAAATPAPVSVPDTTPPGLRLTGAPKRMRRADLLRHGLRITLRVGEGVTADVSLQRRLGRRVQPAAAGDLVLAARRLRASAPAASVRLRVPRGLRAFVPGHGRLRLVAEVRDAAGNANVVRRTIRVRGRAA
jgi:Ca2+-binding RTX toxin-like protein